MLLLHASLRDVVLRIVVVLGRGLFVDLAISTLLACTCALIAKSQTLSQTESQAPKPNLKPNHLLQAQRQTLTALKPKAMAVRCSAAAASTMQGGLPVVAQLACERVLVNLPIHIDQAHALQLHVGHLLVGPGQLKQRVIATCVMRTHTQQPQSHQRKPIGHP